MAASVHRRVFGWRGFGSPATQLMRAVSLLLKARLAIQFGYRNMPGELDTRDERLGSLGWHISW